MLLYMAIHIVTYCEVCQTVIKICDKNPFPLSLWLVLNCADGKNNPYDSYTKKGFIVISRHVV